ncbi:hypothetical protein MXB_2820, partial [Myxobolus squamalis]
NYSITTINLILELFRVNVENKILTIIMENSKYKCQTTNNALERYNRRIGKNFANAYPNLPSFISTIRTEFLYYSERSSENRQPQNQT